MKYILAAYIGAWIATKCRVNNEDLTKPIVTAYEWGRGQFEKITPKKYE